VLLQSRQAISDSRTEVLTTPQLKQFYEYFHCQTRLQINSAIGQGHENKH
jgi:hypothetical protein